MTKSNDQNQKDLKPHIGELDIASRFLSDALQSSFVILKIIMVILVIVFLASGFRTIEPNEQALVLKFGKIRGVGENRLLGPGLQWVFPYPINEIIKIPVTKKVNLTIKSFWYFQIPKELQGKGAMARDRINPTLSPIKDGYCITRGTQQTGASASATDIDYNIIHTKWALTYHINDPEKFYRNIYTDFAKPGEDYGHIIIESITPMLKDLIGDAIVAAMVHYTIDQAISSQDRIPKHVEKLLQQNLDRIESGIRVVSVQLTDVAWPRQVNPAFLASIKASQFTQKMISQSRGYAENTLNEVAGPVAPELFASLRDDTITTADQELLWSNAAGQAQAQIADARAYRTKVVETAKANAEYLLQILPQYRKRPKLVLRHIYLDAIEEVFSNAEEKIIIQPSSTARNKEIRLLLNRDPGIKPEPKQ